MENECSKSQNMECIMKTILEIIFLVFCLGASVIIYVHVRTTPKPIDFTSQHFTIPKIKIIPDENR